MTAREGWPQPTLGLLVPAFSQAIPKRAMWSGPSLSLSGIFQLCDIFRDEKERSRW